MFVCKVFLPFLFLATLTAADPFIGNWKLNVEKSDLRASNVKGGSTTYQPIGAGYVYDAEIVFEGGKAARLYGPVQFDGTANEARLDGRPVKFVSNRLDPVSYQLVITDERTGTTMNILRYPVQGDTLTFDWLDGSERPTLTLIYDSE